MNVKYEGVVFDQRVKSVRIERNREQVYVNDELTAEIEAHYIGLLSRQRYFPLRFIHNDFTWEGPTWADLYLSYTDIVAAWLKHYGKDDALPRPYEIKDLPSFTFERITKRILEHAEGKWRQYPYVGRVLTHVCAWCGAEYQKEFRKKDRASHCGRPECEKAEVGALLKYRELYGEYEHLTERQQKRFRKALGFHEEDMQWIMESLVSNRRHLFHTQRLDERHRKGRDISKLLRIEDS